MRPILKAAHHSSWKLILLCYIYFSISHPLIYPFAVNVVDSWGLAISTLRIVQIGVVCIVFSKESHFCLRARDDRVRIWRCICECLNTAYIIEWHMTSTSSVMVRAAFTYNTRTSLIVMSPLLWLNYMSKTSYSHMGCLLWEGFWQPHTSIMPSHALQGSCKIACLTLPHFFGLKNLQIYCWLNMCGNIWDTNCDSHKMFKISKRNCSNCGQICHRTLYTTSMPPWWGMNQLASMLQAVQQGITVCTVLHIAEL